MVNNHLVEWLLEAETPSIRYMTLRHLEGKSEDDAEVQGARQAMREGGPIPAILAQQAGAGHWEGESSFYTPKYTSTHWSMMLLTELAVDGDDPRFQQGIEFMLADTANWAKRAADSETDSGLLCFWGNLLRYTLHGGRGDDSRAQAVTRLMAREALQWEWRCPHSYHVPCAWGAARALWGLAALPERNRTPEVQQVIADGVKFLLESYHLAEANYPTETRTSKRWTKLNFPLFYQADILFVLRVMTELDALDHPGAQPALDWLRSQRREDGRWQGVSPYSGRTWKSLGGSKEARRWASLQAAMILRQAATA